MANAPQNKEQEFDAYRDTYSDDIDKSLAFSGQAQDFFTRVKAECIVEILQKHFKSDAKNPVKLLDVGCGHGLIHPHLLESAKAQNYPLSLTGIDVAASVVELAKKENPSIAYDTYDGITLPYADNSFDFAFAICVMHHVPPAQWQDFLKEMNRVVKPGGIVSIFEHNPLNPVTVHIVNNCPLDENAVLLRASKLEALYKGAGLNDISKNYILFTPIAAKLFRKLDKMLSWLPLGAQYYMLGHVK